MKNKVIQKIDNEIRLQKREKLEEKMPSEYAKLIIEWAAINKEATL